jgi:antitoxin component YwqK of YwqJK toxin-antitoxin module
VAQFTDSPAQPTAAPEWTSWLRSNAGSALQRLNGDTAYLVRVGTNVANYTWSLKGRKLSEVTIANGKLQGIFRSWHENGMPAEEVMLKDGEPEGKSKAWFSSGFLKSQVTLRNGKIVEKQFYKDGEHSQRTIISSTELSIK